MESVRRHQRCQGPHVAQDRYSPDSSGRHQKIGRSFAGGGCLLPQLLIGVVVALARIFKMVGPSSMNGGGS